MRSADWGRIPAREGGWAGGEAGVGRLAQPDRMVGKDARFRDGDDLKRTVFKVWQPGRCVCVRGSEEKGEAEGEGGCGGCSVKYPVDVWSEGRGLGCRVRVIRDSLWFVLWWQSGSAERARSG